MGDRVGDRVGRGTQAGRLRARVEAGAEMDVNGEEQEMGKLEGAAAAQMKTVSFDEVRRSDKRSRCVYGCVCVRRRRRGVQRERCGPRRSSWPDTRLCKDGVAQGREDDADARNHACVSRDSHICSRCCWYRHRGCVRCLLA